MKYYSQAGQDEWVIDRLGGDLPGYFVDVGAHDGIVHSNTYALEQMGWEGVCVEPARDPFLELVRNRRCFCWPVIAHSVITTVPFDGVRVGLGDHVLAAPLTYVLDSRNAPPVIDYLSIDVEGHELQVLAGMDFNRWHVQLATIEHNLYLRGPEHRDAIRERMVCLGFILAVADVVAPGYGPYEDWWVHEASL